MLPIEAESIYYAALDADTKRQHAENKPIDQEAARMAAWQAVIDAVGKEIDTDWGKRFLALESFRDAFKS